MLSQTLEGYRNGVVFGAMYSSTAEEWTDDATLLTYKDSRLSTSMLSRVLKKMISEHVELYATINERLDFAPVNEIKYADVVKEITFDSYKDEVINCRFGAPPYLIRHIFNQTTFQPGSNNVLWKLYVVDETLVIFHGHDVLFDIFSAAAFHKLFLEALNCVSKSGEELTVVFKNDPKSQQKLSRSIFDNAKLHLPAMAADLLNLQTQSFFKSIYLNAVKRPFDYLNSNLHQQPKEIKMRYSDILRTDNNLCGTTIFGTIAPERFDHLSSIAADQNICLRSFICGITMLCLKPMVKNFNASITFVIPINLRSSIEDSSDFGLYYKNVRVECPLSLIDDKVFQGLTIYNGYDSRSIKPKRSDPRYKEQLLEYQFRQITMHVTSIIKQRLRTWERSDFNDDDIKRMRFTLEEKTTNTKLIQVNDVSDFKFSDQDDKNGGFKIRELNVTRSLSPNLFMSLSYTHTESNGLNICIHYPDRYNMESFVECFQSFMEEN